MRRGIALGITAVLGLVACSGGPGGAPAASAPSPDANEIAAEVGGEKITVGELDTQAKERLYVRETRNGDASAVYELREEALEAWIEERALANEAKKRGIDVDALVAEEVAKRGPVTDAEVSAFYEANKSRVQGRTLEQLADDIRRHLESLREHEVRDALVKQANASIRLEPPRVQVSSSGPALGPDDAPVTLIEFSDFQCPFCARAVPVIQELQKRYPTQLRVVYKHMPLESIHPRARAAAVAAVCADEQGKFWPFHDRIFENRAFGDADLRADAQAVGLDLAKFDACVKGDSHRARIEADMAAANAVGIQGTPGFVLNGLLIRGLQPPEAFAQMIDRELANQAKAEPPAAQQKTSP